MTRQDFLNIDWNDSHVGYDMQVGNYRTVAYLTFSPKYPDCLCFVTGLKDFPVRNSGCGISKNPCPMDVIDILHKWESINRIVAVIDNDIYDINSHAIYINGIDSQVLFDVIPSCRFKGKPVFQK